MSEGAQRGVGMSREGGVGYIAMTAEVLEELDLAQGSLGENLLAENIGDFLDGNAFAGLGIGCGTGREGCWSVHLFHHTHTWVPCPAIHNMVDLPDNTVSTLS